MKNSVDILNAEVQPPVEHDVEKLSHILIAVAPVAVFQLLRRDDPLFFIKTERVAADAQSFRHVSNRILLHNRIPSFILAKAASQVNMLACSFDCHSLIF